MRISHNLHFAGFEAVHYPTDDQTKQFVIIEMEGQRAIDSASLYLHTAAEADELIKAAIAAKSMLLGESSAPDLAAAAESPANPYGPAPLASLREREHYEAAGVAEGAEPECGEPGPTPGNRCSRELGHDGFHNTNGTTWSREASGETHGAYVVDLDSPVAPFPHLPHLPQHQGPSPLCTLCGMDHSALHAIEQTGDAR